MGQHRRVDDVLPLLLRPDLLAEGWTDGELRRRRRSGELHGLRRGAYLLRGDDRLDDAVARHALLVAAGPPLLSGATVVSHVSAAVLHGLEVWGVPLDRVHRTRARRTGGRRSTAAHLHAAPLVADEIVEVDGLLVTSVARTLVDLARTAGFEAAVAIADSALHRGRVDPAALAGAVGRCSGWIGAPQARRVLAFADGRSMSVGESRSRVAMARAGLPTPELQWEVRSVAGRIGFTDFAWPDLGVVGEFDGRVKFGRLLRPGQDPGDAAFAEKVREDRIRDEGWRVVRWTWADLADFGAVASRLRRAMR